ncbi:hypothetical protein [Nitrosopumilus sp.]|uniref:hypothetical protein n=1 Tax=Nitrosopumilus sp. TaxID=2024843 RepID=UPI003D1105A2
MKWSANVEKQRLKKCVYHLIYMTKDFTWLWNLIGSIEGSERKASSAYEGTILFEARNSERMKAWEKVIYWAVLEDKDVA